MKYLTTAVIGSLALLSAGCNNGAIGVPASGGATETASGGANGSGGQVGTGGSGQSGGSTGSGGSSSNTGGSGVAGATGSGGAAETGGTPGTATGGRVATGGSTGSGGAGTGGAGTGTGGAATPGVKTGPFKILVMSSTLEFEHDSIGTCLTMLQDLGKATAPERAKITGLDATTTWTVDNMGRTPSAANYFSEVTADNLKNYEMFYSNNPTGKVFTNAPSGAQKKQIFQDWWTNGGSWAGQHSATDFENNNS